MCFDTDSAPPIPTIAGAAVAHDDLVLQASDGNHLAAFLATPEEPTTTGVVILPDVRGLYHFYEELALRFAERGFSAIAIDYFGRTAGGEKRDDDFEYMPHVEQTTNDGVQADVGAAVGKLHQLDCTSVFTVGFCFGGSNSWQAAAAGHGLAGAIGFYGSPTRERGGSPSVVARVPDMECPILALQAGDDAHITAADNTAFDEALFAGGIEHDVVTFDGAPHSFFDRKHAEFQAASDDAWRRTLEFIAAHA